MKVNYFLQNSHTFPILSQVDQVQISHPVPQRTILILFSRLRLGLLRGLFHSGFPTKILYTFSSIPYVLHVPPISSSFTLSTKYNYLTSLESTLIGVVDIRVPKDRKL